MEALKERTSSDLVRKLQAENIWLRRDVEILKCQVAELTKKRQLVVVVQGPAQVVTSEKDKEERLWASLLSSIRPHYGSSERNQRRRRESSTPQVGVPPYTALYRYYTKFKLNPDPEKIRFTLNCAVHKIFTNAQGKKIVDHIIRCSQMFYGLTILLTLAD